MSFVAYNVCVSRYLLSEVSRSYHSRGDCVLRHMSVLKPVLDAWLHISLRCSLVPPWRTISRSVPSLSFKGRADFSVLQEPSKFSIKNDEPLDVVEVCCCWLLSCISRTNRLPVTAIAGWFANTSKQKVTNPSSPDIPAQPSLQQDEILRASTAQCREKRGCSKEKPKSSKMLNERRAFCYWTSTIANGITRERVLPAPIRLRFRSCLRVSGTPVTEGFIWVN